MSADSRTVCPKCYPDLIGWTYTNNWGKASGAIDAAAEKLGYDRDVRENIDYYLKAKDNQLVLVFEYRADCWTCGWHFDTTLEEPIPGLEQP